MREEEGAEILEEVRDDARPETSGPNLQQRKQHAVDRDPLELTN